MSLTLLDYLYGVALPSGALISELTDCTPKANVEVLTAMCAGDVVPQFIGGQGARPQIDFRSPQIKTILDACGLYGYDASAGNTDLHYRSGTNLSTRAATGLRIRCVRALLYWAQIQARHGGLADVGCTLVPTYDGTNAPMTPAGAITIPGMSALPQQYFTLGPVVINGSPVAGVTDWSLDLGVKTNIEATDGESYPSWCGIESHTPVLTVNTRTLGCWATVGVGGLALISLAFYLRKKRLDNAGCEENVSAVHIKFTATTGVVYIDQSSGGVDGPAGGSLKIHLRRASPSATHCLAANTASAIT